MSKLIPLACVPWHLLPSTFLVRCSGLCSVCGSFKIGLLERMLVLVSTLHEVNHTLPVDNTLGVSVCVHVSSVDPAQLVQDLLSKQFSQPHQVQSFRLLTRHLRLHCSNSLKYRHGICTKNALESPTAFITKSLSFGQRSRSIG